MSKMSSSYDKKSAIMVDSEEDDMRTIELHRADSMVKPPIEIEEDFNAKPKAKEDLYTHIRSSVNSFLGDISHMKVEVVMFLYMFSYVMRSVSSTAMVLDKACIVHLGFSSEICENLKDHPIEKSQVEKLANNYSIAHTLIQMVPSAILGCFIGAWSDTYGRKAPIIVALLGIILDGLGSTLSAAYLHSRIEFYLIPGIFTGISGGFIGVLTVLYSYASDITTYRKRTMKYAIMEMVFGLSMPMGQLAGGWVYRWSGYVPVFLVATGGHVIGLAWVLFLLEETRGLDRKESWLEKFKCFWSIGPVIESMKTTLKHRPNQGRLQILLLIMAMSLSVLTYASTAGINFLYVHHVYDWDNTKYSTVSAVFAIMHTVCMVIAVAIFKKFNLGDPALGIVGTISLMIKNFGYGAATRPGLFYLANTLGLLAGLCNLAARSRISKVTSKNDLGKVFSFLTTAESLVPIAATAAASQIFNVTLDVYPGLIYFVLGGLLIPPLAVYIWLSRLPSVNYEEMHNETEASNLETDEKAEKSELSKY